MRLIDADKIVNFRATADDGKRYVILPIEKLGDIPTAYDVDKVVEEIQEATYCDLDEEYYDNGYCVIDLDSVLDIVKRGGVDANK